MKFFQKNTGRYVRSLTLFFIALAGMASGLMLRGNQKNAELIREIANAKIAHADVINAGATSGATDNATADASSTGGGCTSGATGSTGAGGS